MPCNTKGKVLKHFSLMFRVMAEVLMKHAHDITSKITSRRFKKYSLAFIEDDGENSKKILEQCFVINCT